MGIFSGSFTAETGTVSVEIDGSTIIGGSGTFYVIDIGKMEFSNELPLNDDDTVSTVITKQGSLKVVVANTLTNGMSFYSYLNELEITEQLNCKVTVNGLDTLFAIDYQGVEYDERTEHLTLTFRPRYVFTGTSSYTSISGATTTISTVNFYDPPLGGGWPLPANRASSDYDTAGGTLYNSVYLRDAIEDYLEFLYGTGYTSHIKSAQRIAATAPTGELLQSVATGSVATNDEHVMLGYSAVGGGTFRFSLPGSISRYAAAEGSVFGNAFGVNYYIHRLYTGSDATATFRPEINYNFVEEMSIDRRKNDLLTISNSFYQDNTDITSSGTVVATVTNSDAGVSLNPNGSKTLDIRWRGCALMPGRWNGTRYLFYDTGLVEDVLENGVKAYSKALGGDGSRRIKFKFRNALSLKPYQCFTLSSGAPSIFRASGASSVVYRPSRLYYDFKGDYVEGEAYAIAAV